MIDYGKIKKLMALAGENPTTAEERQAYLKAKSLIDNGVEPEEVKKATSCSGYLTTGPTAKKTTWKDRLFNLKYNVIDKFNLPITITIPKDRIFHREPDEYTIYQIKPSKSVRNNQAYVLAKVMAGFYRPQKELFDFFTNKRLLTVRSPYRTNFRIVMKANDIGFYIIVPTAKASEILRKAEGIYDSSITISKVDSLPKIDASRAFCSELHYRKHEIFSLDTDRSNNYPLPSLLTAVRTLEGDDLAIFDAMLEPYNQAEWLKESRQAYRLLDQGYIPTNGPGGVILRNISEGINALRYGLGDLFAITKEQKLQLKKHKREEKGYLEARRIKETLTTPTKRKQDDAVLKTWLRIAVHSDDKVRARAAAYTLANAWADIKSDNELDRVDIPAKWVPKYVEAIENRKPINVVSKSNKMSVEEVGKLIQLPGDALIKEFPEIEAQNLREVKLPEELTQDDIPHVRYGYVTERGKKQLACIPLVGYKTPDGQVIPKKAVYDALCTATFGQGKQGSGKSEGFGTTWAYDMVVNGLTAIIIDTADGQVLRNFINSLPADYPDEKIHALNFDNKAYPIAANWSDIMGRTFAGEGDEELQALEISERITARFVSFINSLTMTGEFTDRMRQYVESCMRAVTKKAVWSFLDLELALTSPAYRAELLQLEAVKQMPEVCYDLRTLQDKAQEGKVGQITDPILSRIKQLSSTQFMANMFYQEPKLTKEGKPVLDLRHLMDNPEGGYGHTVVIQASADAWQDNQSTILGFFVDKINFNAFSRVDQEQADRKPVLVWIDEPHKVIKSIEGRLAGTSVEFRKYRVKNLFTGHSIEQMGAAANSLLDGGAQITSYKTERLSELQRFAHVFKPYDNAKDLYESLPEKHHAISSVRLPSGKTCPAFLAHMVAPPAAVKDRSKCWKQSAEKYGRPWKEVRDQIQNKRQAYNELDEAWYEEQEEAVAAAKAAAAEALKQAKEAAKKNKKAANM